jgi:hypothetical protein
MPAGTLGAVAKPVVSAALTGTGSTLGSAAGGFLGGPVGAALGGLAGQYIAGQIDPAMKAQREQQAKDIRALQQGKLGLSEAEKRTMLAGTQRGLQAQTAGMEANLRRQAAAQGGFGRSGAQQKALGNIAAQQAEQLAQYAGRVDALSQQKAENRFQDIMGRLERRRAEALKAGAETGAALVQTPAAMMLANTQAKDALETRLANQAAQVEAARKAAEAEAQARAKAAAPAGGTV